MWQAGLSFHQQVLQNSLLSNGYLYLHSTDTVLCNGSVYTPQLVMQVIHEQAGDVLEQQEWFELLKQYH